jgi:glycosyltransferase involved in cell wall biosynthesis
MHAVETGIPIAWSPHGMLAPWAMRHKGWKKWPVWWLWQKRDLTKADMIHATSDLEAGWIRGLGLRNKLSVVPLGTPLPEKTVCLQTEEKIVLFVGRIYPVKGLVNLLQAWSLLSEEAERGFEVPDFSSWKLRIVGPDEAGHKSELERLIDAKGLRGCVEFAGAKYGELLDEEYDKCECLVLPSFTENFGATVLEALAHGRPCVASTFTPWKELEEKGCGWWVSNEPDELAKAIREMISIGGAKRREMGDRGRKLVEEKYSWNSVAAKMLKEYASLL